MTLFLFQVDHCKDPDDESLVVVTLASGLREVSHSG